MASLNDPFVVSTEPDLVDVDLVHRFLSDESYWAKGISKDAVRRAIEHSRCYVLLEGTEQIGFARVVTDTVAFAYLCDVFVVPSRRGLGLGKRIVSAATSDPETRGVRRWLLGTLDAHGLYEQHGFTPMPHPDRFMERFLPDAYSRRQE